MSVCRQVCGGGMGWTPVPACCWLLITMAAGWWSTHRPRWPGWSCGCMPLRSAVMPGDRSGGWGAAGGGRGPGVAGEARAHAEDLTAGAAAVRRVVPTFAEFVPQVAEA